MNNQTAAPKRPKLSLQIKTSPGRNVRPTKPSLAIANPNDPTNFNTLSNLYVTAIERSTPVQSTPLTAINLTQAQPPAQAQAQAQKEAPQHGRGLYLRMQTPGAPQYPDTPISANPMSPAAQMDYAFPSTMTATPPLSAGPVDQKQFSFESSDASRQPVPASPAAIRRRAIYAPFNHGKGMTATAAAALAPYAHNKSLHSILRNSPLPPATADAIKSPISPRRQSLRLQEKAARRVGYESPLTQTITTEKYTKSHVDLLIEEASPYTPTPAIEDSEQMLDLTMAYSGDETRDGGQTPGPFEEMRRRMTGLGVNKPSSPTVSTPGGIRKRKGRSKEKKRRWVWTIGNQDDDACSPSPRSLRHQMSLLPVNSTKTEDVASSRNFHRSAKSETPEPLTAVKISVEQIPPPSLPTLEPIPDDTTASTTTEDEAEDRMDIDTDDQCSTTESSRATTPHSFNADMDSKTPTVPVAPMSRASPAAKAMVTGAAAARYRLGSVDSLGGSDGGREGTRRDTPIPPDLIIGGQ